MNRLQSLRERLRASLWFIPAVFALGAIMLAFVLLNVDRELSRNADAIFLYGGTPDGARSVLSTVAQSMLTFTGLVFTITMLVLQLASSQLSPRVMRTFLRDRSNQVVLGLFVATFVYALAVLRDVRAGAEGDEAFVPGLSIWVGFALLLASVAAFIYYIDHMAHGIRASTVITSIARETRQAIERLYPDPVRDRAAETPAGETSDDASVALEAPRAGVLVSIDEGGVLEAVGSHDRGLRVLPAIGDFLPQGAPMAYLSGDWDEQGVDTVRAAFGIEDERSMEQDAAFGFRQLVDIAIRALSPGTNDPTTAVQALDRLHDLLRLLVTREVPSPIMPADSRRALRVLQLPDWDDYVELAVDEIRLAGQGQLQIGRRLRSMLEDLLSIAPDHRKAVLRRELDLVEAMAGGGRAGPASGDDRGAPAGVA